MLARFFLLRAENRVLRFSSLRVRSFFPSVSKSSQTGWLETYRKRMGAGELCPTAWGSDVTIVENSQRENLLMGIVKQVKRAGSF
jgi:hypothetical protein